MEEGVAIPDDTIEEVLPFSYHLYVTQETREDTTQVVAETLEKRLHLAMAFRFLKCQQQQRRRLQEGEWAGVDSSPADVVASACPAEVDTVENADCYVVDAGVTPIYVPQSTKEELQNRVGAFLVEQMDDGGLTERSSPSEIHPNFVGMSFGSFVSDDLVTPEEPERGDDVSGVQRDNSSEGRTSPKVFGGLAIAVAVCAVLLVAGMILRQRRNGRAPGEHFVKQVDEYDENEDLSLDGRTASSGMYSPGKPEAAIILTGSAEEDDESRFSVPKVAGIEHLDHDSDACQSKTCPICQAKLMSQPTFVSADMELEIQKDLGPQRSGSGESAASRKYCSPNTVDL